MKLCYQVATPDVAVSPAVTAYQGPLETSFSELARLGYDGVELMTISPDLLDWKHVRRVADDNGLCVALVCTGEVYAQKKLSFTDPDAHIRSEAVREVKRLMEFAAALGAKVNIGRVRGQYMHGIAREQTYEWAVDAFRSIAAYGETVGVDIAVEPVCIMQTNFLNTVAECAKMVDDVGCRRFRLMMDVFHMNIEEKNVEETIRKYAPYNIHVHLADNNRRYPGNCGTDFQKLLSVFREVGYDGAFCTEIFQEPDQQTAARESIRHLRPILNRVYGA